MKTSSPATLRNQEPILNVLKEYLPNAGRLLEIGSGTGQHAIYFGQYFNELKWVTSDVSSNHAVIKAWINDSQLDNVLGPETLEVGKDDFPKGSFQYVFTANTLHIMSWKENKSLFKLLGKRLREGALVFIYGPFNYAGEFTSLGNKDFNQWLKDQNSKSGIRNFEDVCKAMTTRGFKLLEDHEMPANNRLLVFERLAFS